MGHTGVRLDVVVTMSVLFNLRPDGQSSMDLAHHSLIMLQKGSTKMSCWYKLEQSKVLSMQPSQMWETKTRREFTGSTDSEIWLKDSRLTLAHLKLLFYCYWIFTECWLGKLQRLDLIVNWQCFVWFYKLSVDVHKQNTSIIMRRYTRLLYAEFILPYK